MERNLHSINSTIRHLAIDFFDIFCITIFPIVRLYPFPILSTVQKISGAAHMQHCSISVLFRNAFDNCACKCCIGGICSINNDIVLSCQRFNLFEVLKSAVNNVDAKAIETLIKFIGTSISCNLEIGIRGFDCLYERCLKIIRMFLSSSRKLLMKL
jgi:hypothetical protein